MIRTIISLFALAVATFAIAPAFADDPDLKTSEGIKKFWEARPVENGNGGGN